MKALFDWLDHRVGYRVLLKEALYEKVPGGARWRYVWGSTLTFAIMVQFITGIFLWMFYSPSAQTAWESVFHIQEQVPGGWLVRGIHHWTAQVMTVLLLLHLVQVVIDGAYRAPRELNFWFGLFLLGITLALSLTGYLLPWDQKGYWASKVATNLMGGVPFIGDQLQKIVVGGSDYGHHTLTRFFALHAGVLPASLIGLIVLHIYLFRRHGITPKQPLRKRDGYFWPDQLLKDAVACLAVVAAVLVFVFWKGTELTAPANPGEQYAAARPDWYFMFLFEFLKHQETLFHGWPGGPQLWAAIIVPGAAFGLFMLLPLIGAMKWKVPGINRRLGDCVSVLVLWLAIFAFLVLTTMAFYDDNAGEHGKNHQAALQHAHHEAERTKQLAKLNGGIPPEGALALLSQDPLTQGPRLFKANCASCHTHGGTDGLGGIVSKSTAADLKGFASRDWLTEFLSPAHINTPKYWGNTAFAKPPADGKVSKMLSYITDDIAGYDDQQKKDLAELIIGLSAQANLKQQAEADQRDQAIIAKLPELIGENALDCTSCHRFGGEGKAPDLKGYGSRAWLTEFVKDPAHDKFYGKRNDRMPSYGGVTEPGRDPKPAKLSDKDLGLIVDWLRGEWKE